MHYGSGMIPVPMFHVQMLDVAYIFAGKIANIAKRSLVNQTTLIYKQYEDNAYTLLLLKIKNSKIHKS